jgi:hypothetical protein
MKLCRATERHEATPIRKNIYLCRATARGIKTPFICMLLLLLTVDFMTKNILDNLSIFSWKMVMNQ